jgi:hypothetical protein
MANDNMRTGPLGATLQASKLGPRVVQFYTNSAAVDLAAVEVAINAALKGPAFTSGPLIKHTAVRNLYAMPGMNGLDTYGGEWIVTKLWVQNTVEFATNPLTVNIGIYARNATNGDIKAIDTNAISAAAVIPEVAQGSIGAMFELPLNGDGAGVESYTTAAPASNTVSMRLGSGTAQFADDNTDVTGHDQFLVVTTAGISAGAGECAVFAELKCVGGTEFKT